MTDISKNDREVAKAGHGTVRSIKLVTFISLFPMILLMPFWIAVGRGMFGASGWLFFLTLPLAVVVILPFHILIAILALFGARAKLALSSAALILLYYLLAVGFELSLVDGGDTSESVGSALTFAGVPEGLNSVISFASFWGGIVVMISIVASLIREIIRRRRQAALQPTTIMPAETTTTNGTK